jgi:hypothetical protein
VSGICRSRRQSLVFDKHARFALPFFKI